jgi:general secretion pathway protein D
MNKNGWWKSCGWLLLIAAGFAGASLWAQESNEPVRSRVYSLHYITAAQGKAYIDRLKLGMTVSQIGQSNALVVTALPNDLVKISTLFEVVDSKQIFVIDRLGPADMIVPSPAAIMAKLDGVSVGKFMDPPSHSKKSPAILDIQDGSTVLVSQEGMSDNIIRVINQLRSDSKQADEATSAAAVSQETPQKAKAFPANVTEANKPAATAAAAAVAEANATTDEEMLNKVVKQLLTDQNQPPAVPKETLAQPEKSAMTETPPQEAAEPTTAPDEAVPTTPEESTAASPPAVPGVAEPTMIPHGQEELTLSLPETVDVIALLDLVRQYLNINYLYDPTKINGTVTLKIRDNRIKVSELYALTESVLKFKGFVMSRRDNLVTIVPAADALTIDPTMKSAGEKVKPGDVVVTTVYNLKYMSAQSAQALLTGLKLGTSINPVTETNTLIVTDYAYRMDRIDKLIALVDQPGAPKQFKFRQLKYTTASSLVPKIQSIAQQIGTETINVQTGQTSMPGRQGMRSRPQPAMPQPPQPGAAQSNQPTIFLDADERTNRLLMVGQEKEIALINELIDTFDVPQQDLRSIKEYEIQFVDAKEVVDTLSTLGIVSGTTQGTQTRGARIPSPAMAQPQPNPQAGTSGAVAASPNEEPQIAVLETTNSLLVNATPEQHAQIVMVIAYVDRQPSEVAIPYVVYPLEFQKPSELKTSLTELIEKSLKDEKGKVTSTVSRGEDITIVADDKAFSLIVYASRKNQDWVGSLIRQLDRKRPQVLIDVTLVEITRDDTFNYDLSMIAGSHQFTPGPTDSETAPTSSPFLGLPIPNAGGVHDTEFKSGASGGQFFYSDSHVQALLTAVQKKSYGRVLSKPKILVNDNEEGKISTTQTTYRSIDTTQIPTTGSAITSQTFQSYDAKIELTIKPHISEGDLLLLEVKMTREDFKETDQSIRLVNPSPPDKIASNVDSKVLVPDGATIILGGMIKLNQSKGGSKVPFLGDLPLIGILFRTVNDADHESKLYIFVKAYALRPIDGRKGLPQAENISNENREAFEKSERIFQRYNDIPAIKPKPMDPNNVLDEL